MNLKNPRVRFAPAPTGMMHLGNVRTALMNYLLAQQQKGTFIIRVEDTDPERNFDPGAVKILEDLAWLGLTYQEGPHKDGGHGPYYQSKRTDIYRKKLDEFIKKILSIAVSVHKKNLIEKEIDKLHLKNHRVTIKLVLSFLKKHQTRKQKLYLLFGV